MLKSIFIIFTTSLFTFSLAASTSSDNSKINDEKKILSNVKGTQTSKLSFRCPTYPLCKDERKSYLQLETMSPGTKKGAVITQLQSN